MKLEEYDCPGDSNNARPGAASHLNAGDGAVLSGACGLELNVAVLCNGAGADAVTFTLLHGVALASQSTLIKSSSTVHHNPVQRHLVPSTNTQPRPKRHILQRTIQGIEHQQPAKQHKIRKIGSQ